MAVLDLLLPPACAGCGCVGPSPCDDCLRALCPWGVVSADGVEMVAATAYDELSRRFVVDLKARGRRTSVGWMAASVATTIRWAGLPCDLVTWVPASSTGRRRRGFDQGRVLAVRAARCLGVPTASLLRRSDPARQVGRGRVERLSGASAFTAAPKVLPRIRGADVIVVDDVVTTGASMTGAIHAVQAAGARRVSGAAFAHKP